VTAGAHSGPDTPGCPRELGSLGHPGGVATDDDVPPPTGDLSAYRRARQERASDAVIEMFADVLGKPLVRRELTPHEQAIRENRLRSRGRVTG
jgi:hypothetical protein